MTSTQTRRAHSWLNPGTAVLAVAVMALVVTLSALTTQRLLGKTPAAAQPAAPAPAPTTSGPSYSIAGKLRLPAGQYQTDGAGCRATAFSTEAQVIVTDGQGASLTYAPIGAGQIADGRCDLPFTLRVPVGEGSYGVDVPTWGLAKYSEKELADTLDLTFG